MWCAYNIHTIEWYDGKSPSCWLGLLIKGKWERKKLYIYIYQISESEKWKNKKKEMVMGWQIENKHA